MAREIPYFRVLDELAPFLPGKHPPVRAESSRLLTGRNAQTILQCHIDASLQSAHIAGKQGRLGPLELK